MKKLFLLFLIVFVSKFSVGQDTLAEQVVDTCKLPAEENNCVYQSVTVEQPAEYPGGNEAMNQFLSKNINWPGCCKDEYQQGIQGKVYVKFIVEKDGSISTVEVLKCPVGGKAMADEVVRAIKSMPKWNPAMQGDKFCRMYFVLPVNLKIDNTPSKKKKH